MTATRKLLHGSECGALTKEQLRIIEITETIFLRAFPEQRMVDQKRNEGAIIWVTLQLTVSQSVMALSSSGTYDQILAVVRHLWDHVMGLLLW